MLRTLSDVGLDYIPVGQQATTLSGGEAQRVKLATELCKRDTGRTVYILDEPTTGLHFDDVAKLLEVLHELVDRRKHRGGDRAQSRSDQDGRLDHRHGPRGGDGGGEIVAMGTPEAVVKEKRSYTGAFLKPVLARRGAERRKGMEAAE